MAPRKVKAEQYVWDTNQGHYEDKNDKRECPLSLDDLTRQDTFEGELVDFHDSLVVPEREHKTHDFSH